MKSGRIANTPAKDTIYDLLKSSTYNCRKFLALVSSHLIETYIRPLTSKARDCVLILDDSTYDRNRSKVVELLSRVKGHTTGDYVKGFRMLTLGWSDGATFLPLVFSLLSSKKAVNRYQEMNPAIDKRTVGYRRRQEAIQKGTETMFTLLDEINPLKLCAKTLLFDSWFAKDTEFHNRRIRIVIHISFRHLAKLKKNVPAIVKKRKIALIHRFDPHHPNPFFTIILDWE